MKAYRFRLDSVLRVRQLQQRAAAQQLALAARDLDAARTELARADRALDGLAAPSGRVTVEVLHWTHAQAERMADTVRRGAEGVEAAREAADRAAQGWGSARRRTTVLERLDERHLAAWRAESDRREAAELDDLATVRMAGEAGRP